MVFNTNWLSDWAKRFELTIDSSKIDTTISGLPVFLDLRATTGINGADVITPLKAELSIADYNFSDDFTAASGSAPNDDKWRLNQPDDSYIQIEDNKATCYAITVGANAYPWLGSISRWYFVGSTFNVEASQGYIPEVTDSTDWLHYFGVRSKSNASNDYARMEYRWIGGANPVQYRTRVRNNGVDAYGTTRTTTASGFGTKIVRNGSTVDVYYDVGAGWQLDLSTSCSNWAYDMEIWNLMYNYDYSGGDTTAVLYIDNITINSGGIHHYYHDKKIAVTDADQNQLYVEIEDWQFRLNRILLWTEVPLVTASGVDTKLYLYYDKTKDANTNYVGEVGEAAGRNVWDDNYLAVYHLETGTSPTGAGDVEDSTANAEHNTGINGTPNLLTAKAGRGLNFDPGSSEYININNFTALNGVSEFTFSFVLKSDEMPFTQFRGVFSRGTGTQRTPWVYTSNSAASITCHFEMDDASNATKAVAGLEIDTWHALDYVWDGNELRGYLDGSEYGSGSSTTGNIMANDDGNRFIGYILGYDYWDGILDEIRISNTARSDAYIKASYYSTWDELISYSSEQNYPPMYLTGTTYDKYGHQITESCKIIVSDLDGEFVDATTTSEDGTFSIGIPAPAEERFVVTFYKEGTYGLDDDIAGAIFMTPVVSGTS